MSGNVIRGLTLWQPMAWAIAAGHKPIENRSWRPRGVTHLAIHAGSKYHRPHADQMLEFLGIEPPARSELDRMAIIAVARLNGFVESSDSPWFSGPFGWCLEEVRALADPIPRKGMLGLWSVTLEERQEIERQVPGLAPLST